MKKLLALAFICSMLATATTAHSYTIGATDVGLQDSLLYSANLKDSGDGAETSWVQDMLNRTDIVLTAKYDTVAANWQKVDPAGSTLNDLWALNLLYNPEYFLVKTGNTKNENKYDTYLFQNNEELSWAVISLADVNITDIMTVSKISHVDEFSGTPVPEPGTMMLLGAGFLGLAVYSKRRKNN